MNWLLTILSWLLGLFASREAARREGEAKAERERVEAIIAEVRKADAERIRAVKRYRDIVSDSAFDQDFERK
jgi:hypothetical protein